MICAMTTFDEALGAAVHQAMWVRRLQQIDVAPRAGMTQSALSRKMYGKRPWSAEDVLQVAEAIGADPAKLWATALSTVRASRTESLPKAAGDVTGEYSSAFRSSRASRMDRGSFRLPVVAHDSRGMAAVIPLRSCESDITDRVAV
jgi:lambda repressor-like predicted transcriptional regulator